MNKIYKFILGAVIILMLFLVNFVPERMPQHIDSWIQVSWAKVTKDNGGVEFKEPFSGKNSSYPPGERAFLAFLSAFTGLSIIQLVEFLPPVLLVVLGLCLYLLSKEIFKDDLLALCVMAFTPLVISNMTILGPYYLVPLTFGMILSLLLFYFVLKERIVWAVLAMAAIVLTHRSTSVFAAIGVCVIFALNTDWWRNRRKLLMPLGVIGAGLAVFSWIVGFERIIPLVARFLFNEKQPPFISFKWEIPWFFVLLLGVGIYYSFQHKRAVRTIIPLFALLSLNAFLYWHYDGMLLVYRRLFGFLFLMVPFFVGAGVYYISRVSEPYIRNRLPKKYNKHILPSITAVLLLALVPLAISVNIDERSRSIVYVTREEHQLFEEFAKEHEGEYLAAGFLESFALPYYGLRAVQGSPRSTGSPMEFKRLNPCYVEKDEQCFVEFFNESRTQNRYNLTYVYPHTKLEGFNEYMRENGKVIYKYD